MKNMVVTVKVEATDFVTSQMKRTGFTIVKSGSMFRLQVAGQLVGCDQATITFEELHDNHAQER